MGTLLKYNYSSFALKYMMKPNATDKKRVLSHLGFPTVGIVVVVVFYILYQQYSIMRTATQFFEDLDTQSDRFHPVKQRSHKVFSAYYDDRLQYPLIRVLGFKQRDDTGLLYCKLYMSATDVKCLVSPALLERMSTESQNYQDEEYFFVCPLTPDMKPVAVALSASAQCQGDDHALKITYPPDVAQREFGVCLSSPAHGTKLSHEIDLLEMFEVNRLLGADGFTIYNWGLSKQLLPTLNAYIDKGILELVSWSPGVDRYKTLLRHGAVLALNDCLYRNMYKYRYLVFTDFDELLMPHLETMWDKLLSVLPPTVPIDGVSLNVAAYMFPNVWYYPDKNYTSKTRTCFDSEQKVRFPKIMSHNWRTRPLEFPIGAKGIIKSQKVISVSTNEMYRLMPGYGIHNASVEYGHVHHFRPRTKAMEREHLMWDTTAGNAYGAQAMEQICEVLQKGPKLMAGDSQYRQLT